MAGPGKRRLLRPYLLSVMEVLVVAALLLGFAFTVRHHLVDGHPRRDLVKLLFFACVFGGAFIVEARLQALLAGRRVFVVEETSCSPRRWAARFYIAGYVVLVLSAILIVVAINL